VPRNIEKGPNNMIKNKILKKIMKTNKKIKNRKIKAKKVKQRRKRIKSH